MATFYLGASFHRVQLRATNQAVSEQAVAKRWLYQFPTHHSGPPKWATGVEEGESACRSGKPTQDQQNSQSKLCKRLASTTTENMICGHNSSDPGMRNENDGLIVYGKQKRQPHYWLPLWWALINGPPPVLQEESSSSQDSYKEPQCVTDLSLFDSFCLARTPSQHFPVYW